MSSALNQFKLLRKKSAYREFEQAKIIKVYKDQKIPKAGVPFTDDLFPPNQNSILGRDSNGEFIDKVDGPKKQTLFNLDEIEWKRAGDIFPEQLLFEGTISVDDVKQGKIGNCYFLSAIVQCANFPV